METFKAEYLIEEIKNLAWCIDIYRITHSLTNRIEYKSVAFSYEISPNIIYSLTGLSESEVRTKTIELVTIISN